MKKNFIQILDSSKEKIVKEIFDQKPATDFMKKISDGKILSNDDEFFKHLEIYVRQLKVGQLERCLYGEKNQMRLKMY